MLRLLVGLFDNLLCRSRKKVMYCFNTAGGGSGPEKLCCCCCEMSNRPMVSGPGGNPAVPDL